MNIGNIGNASLNQTTKPKAKPKAKQGINIKDSWSAGGQKFDNFNDIGAALKSGKLSMPKSGEMKVVHKGSRADEAAGLKSTAKKFALASVAGFGIALGAAALGITAPALIILPMMGGMLSMGIADGTYKAGQSFEKEPQIKDRGTITMDNGKVNFQKDEI